MAGLTKSNLATQADVAALAAQAEREAMCIHAYGEVVDYDPATQQATVKLMGKSIGSAEHNLIEVPIGQARSGGFRFTLPVVAGTKIDLEFLDKDNDEYLETGKASEPYTARLNSASDARGRLGIQTENDVPTINNDILYIGTDDGANGTEIKKTGETLIKSTKTIDLKSGESCSVESGNAVSIKSAASTDIKAGGKLSTDSKGLSLKSNGEELVSIVSEMLGIMGSDITVVVAKHAHPLMSAAQYAGLKTRLDSMK